MSLHRYTGALLDNVWLQNGFRRHETKWGQGTSYEDTEGLFRAIALELCLSHHRLDATGFRFLRKYLELTQAEIGQEFGLSSQAVAKWEKGDIAIPVAEGRLLRLLVLRKIVPMLTIDQGLTQYDEPAPDKMVFAHSPEVGWHCAEHIHEPITATVTRKPLDDFIRSISPMAFSGRFDPAILNAFANNDHHFSHASELTAA
jgi:DNA-binding transcriptional regulator YiaG